MPATLIPIIKAVIYQVAVLIGLLAGLAGFSTLFSTRPDSPRKR